jgi:hypothetical protein
MIIFEIVFASITGILFVVGYLALRSLRKKIEGYKE